jgi:hypothetical protein
MESSGREAFEASGPWGKIASGFTALLRHSGCSVDQSPLPELREVARDIREWHQAASEPAA